MLVTALNQMKKRKKGEEKLKFVFVFAIKPVALYKS